MSLERTVCELVKRHWSDLHPDSQAPDSLVFLKVAGKNSPNAAIIAMVLDARRRRAVAVAKIPRNPQSTVGIEREYEAMRDITESVSDPGILAHTPCHGKLVESDGVKILLQAAGVGHPMVREMTSRESIEALYEKILPWMFNFHANGAEEFILEGELLRTLVEAPIARFMKQFGDVSAEILSSKTRQYISELPKKVKGRSVHLCRQHGDFNAHNTLVEYNRRRLDNFTLIDWEDYQIRQLPIHDLNHFFTSNSHLLGAGMPPEESYSKLVIGDGWYQDLYVRAVADYEECGLIDRHTFWALTPLYMIEMCCRITNVQRKQQDTAPTWIKRMTLFSSRYLREVK